MAAPANDLLVNAVVLDPKLLGKAEGTNVEATLETGESTKSRSGITTTNTVWFKWTAPADATDMVFWAQVGFDAVLDVFTGSTIGTLTRVPDTYRLVWTGHETGVYMSPASVFTPTPGVTYMIRVGGVFISGNVRTGPFTLRWQTEAAGISDYLTPPPTEQSIAPQTYWVFSKYTPTVFTQPGDPVPNATGYAAAWAETMPYTYPGDGLPEATQQWSPGAPRQSDVDFSVIGSDGGWSFDATDYLVSFPKPNTADYRPNPEPNMGQFPRTGEYVEWEPGVDTELVPGGRIAVTPYAEPGGGTQNPGATSTVEVIKRYKTSDIWGGDNVDAAVPWPGDYDSFVEGDSLGYISATDSTITANFGEVSTDLSTEFAASTIGSEGEYINLILRNRIAVDMPPYIGSPYLHEIYVGPKLYLRVQLPRYKKFTWITEGVTWWDGAQRQPATVNGWWSTADNSVATVALRGWWDGTSVQPVIGGS